MKVEPEQLIAFLLDANLITGKDVADVRKTAEIENKRLEAVLLDKKLVSFEELIKLKAYILGIPFVNLEQEKIPLEVLQIIPEPITREHNIVAFRKSKDSLEVAMLDPEDLQTIDFIKKKSNLNILPRLTSRESVQNALSQYQKSLKAEFGDIIHEESDKASVLPEDISDEQLYKVSQDLPIVRIVNTLIKHAILQHASDIHIEPLEKELIVRYRIDGVLRDAMTLPVSIASAVVARIKVSANLRIDERRLPQDGRFKVEGGQNVSMRVSTMPVYDGEKIVMRLLFEDSEAFTLENLGFQSGSVELIHREIKRPHGMILITGPTGSGKTTTLYTLMEILNRPGVNISTVEDPIEYRMPRINQTQVNPKIGLTFANGLRSLIRQDPDIIMVGEIRDNETAALAVNAALTGHLVLSTLHTNSAAGALPRLVDMKVEPFLIASTVNAIIAQRLVRRLCPDIRNKYRLSESEIASLEKEINLKQILEILKKNKAVKSEAGLTDIDFFKPGSSESCPGGYKGRVGIYEILIVSDTLRELVVRRSTTEEINAVAKKAGMISMLEDGFMKVARGISSIEEILVATQE